MSPSPTPLALSDSELDQIMSCAAQLDRRLRRSFIEHVAHRLRGKELGDGAVYRACREVLKESGLFSPPLETEAHALGHGQRTRERERERGGVS